LIRLSAGKQGVTAEQKAIWDRIAARGNAPSWAVDASSSVATAQIAPAPKGQKLAVGLESEDDFPPLSAAKHTNKGKHVQSPSLSTQHSQLTSTSTTPSTPVSGIETMSTGDTEVSMGTSGKLSSGMDGEARPLDRFVSMQRREEALRFWVRVRS
jgi:hypothetical protein